MMLGSGFSGSNFFLGSADSADFGSVASAGFGSGTSADVAVVAAVVSDMLVPLSALRSGVRGSGSNGKSPAGRRGFFCFYPIYSEYQVEGETAPTLLGWFDL
jgi:hypothetical protein